MHRKHRRDVYKRQQHRYAPRLIQIREKTLLYHDAAKRPQQNRIYCGFAWFNVLKALCAGTGACAAHTRSRASGGGFKVSISHRKVYHPRRQITSSFAVLQKYYPDVYKRQGQTSAVSPSTHSSAPPASGSHFICLKSSILSLIHI